MDFYCQLLHSIRYSVAATHLRCDGTFNDYCVGNVLLSVAVNSTRIAQKQLGGRAPNRPSNRRHARYMWHREDTLLDPPVGGGGAVTPLLQNF